MVQTSVIFFSGCLLYADDIVLLSPTCRGLHKLITACEQYGGLRDLKFNSLKSQVATFGSKCPTNSIITLLNAPLEWADKVKYIGVYIVSNTALTDISNHVRQFYSRFNNVLSVIGKGGREMCTHSLTHCCAWPAEGRSVLRSGLRGKELRGNAARGSELRGNGARPSSFAHLSLRATTAQQRKQ